MEDMITKSPNQTMTKYSDMKHCKTLYHSIYMIACKVVLIGIFFFLWSCNRNIDTKIKDCYNSNDTIIKLSDLYPEEWDTVYFFGSCSVSDIAKRTGPVIYNLWHDVGDKMLILNKKNEVVYYKEWDMYYGQNLEGAIFRFNSDSIMIAIPRKDAKFLIKKRDEDSFWVIYQGDHGYSGEHFYK